MTGSLAAARPVSATPAAIEPQLFRQVLGQYPTGVCVITAMQSDGRPAGMVVGSFTSVSLDPPLVAFFPDRNSASWGKLKGCSRFCVNILSAEQERVCQKLASKDPDKFADIRFRVSPGGAPIIDGVVAWIDCDLHSVAEAGDHFMVMGLVSELEIAAGGLPLLFFQGGYGRFAPCSLVTSDTQGFLAGQLRMIDRARPEMERIAADVGVQCLASLCVGDELVIAASAGQAQHAAVTLVGQRLPFVPPIGSVFAAWLPDGERERWLGGRAEAGHRDEYRAGLDTVRSRGFSVSRLNEAQRALVAELERHAQSEPAPAADLEDLVRALDFDPAELTAEVCSAIRVISAPIFDESGRVVMALALDGFPQPSNCARIADYAARLLEGADRVTTLLGGRRP